MLCPEREDSLREEVGSKSVQPQKEKISIYTHTGYVCVCVVKGQKRKETAVSSPELSPSLRSPLEPSANVH